MIFQFPYFYFRVVLCMRMLFSVGCLRQKASIYMSYLSVLIDNSLVSEQ